MGSTYLRSVLALSRQILLCSTYVASNYSSLKSYPYLYSLTFLFTLYFVWKIKFNILKAQHSALNTFCFGRSKYTARKCISVTVSPAASSKVFITNSAMYGEEIIAVGAIISTIITIMSFLCQNRATKFIVVEISTCQMMSFVFVNKK